MIQALGQVLIHVSLADFEYNGYATRHTLNLLKSFSVNPANLKVLLFQSLQAGY